MVARSCWLSREIPLFDVFEQQFYFLFYFFFPRRTWLIVFNTEVNTPGPSSPANMTAGLEGKEPFSEICAPQEILLFVVSNL